MGRRCDCIHEASGEKRRASRAEVKDFESGLPISVRSYLDSICLLMFNALSFYIVSFLFFVHWQIGS